MNCHLLLMIIWMSAALLPGSKAIGDSSETGAAARFNEANEYYRDARFAEALDRYDALIEDGIRHPDLYYNASNAAYRLGHLGKAILYQERALRLQPSDDDIRANLAFLRAHRRDGTNTPANPIVAFLSGTFDRMYAGTFAHWSLGAFILALFGATGALYLSGWKRIMGWVGVGILGTLFLVSSGLFIAKLHHQRTVTEAIIMESEANLYAGPSIENTRVFTIHEGTKVIIDRVGDGWNLIRLDSGAAGWIEDSLLERI